MDRELVEARLADGMRDLQIAPAASQHFAACTAPLDENGWRRLALATTVLESADFSSVLSLISWPEPLGDRICETLARVATVTDALSLTLIGESDLRAEEFARHVAAHLGVTIAGETPDQSNAILDRLDFRRLLEEAARAKDTAQGQFEYLRQLQAMQELGRRRGKW